MFRFLIFYDPIVNIHQWYDGFWLIGSTYAAFCLDYWMSGAGAVRCESICADTQRGSAERGPWNMQYDTRINKYGPARPVMFNHRAQFVLNNTILSHIICYFVGYVSRRSVRSILTNLISGFIVLFQMDMIFLYMIYSFFDLLIAFIFQVSI